MVRPAKWFAEKVVYLLIDKRIIDGFLHTVARVSEWVAFRNKDFDTYVVNGFGDAVPNGIGNLGDAFKYVQSGRIQQYLAVGLAGVLMLAAVFVYFLFFAVR